MSKATYKLTTGLAHVISTGEPVFVTGYSPDTATVVRPVVTQNGIVYQTETFPTNQLESPYAQVKRRLEFEDFVRDLQEKMQEKRFSLSAAQKRALEHQANNPSQGTLFNGDGDING